jgi:hypothetical protein
MRTRGLLDRKGELFAYLEGDVLYTLESEATGRLEAGFIIDMVGNKIWRIEGDAVYAIDSGEVIGYLSDSSPDVR